MQAEHWTDICEIGALQPFAGVAALVDGRQLAIFYLPGNNADQIKPLVRMEVESHAG